MQIEIRLRKILRDHNLDRHGIEQRLATDLNVHRHTIGKLYRNQLTNPSLKVLGELCDWLQAHGVSPDILPQALLGSRPAGLWRALAGQGTVHVYLGEYQETREGSPSMLWISRRDSMVASELVQILTTPGDWGPGQPTVLLQYVPFRFAAPGSSVKKKQFREDIALSKETFAEMPSRSGLGSSILVGSQRVLFLLEYFVADLFGCRPFKRFEGTEIKTPFFLVYRDHDRAVPSCFGDQRNPPKRKGKRTPGICYLDSDGRWVSCPWLSRQQDAGIIMTVYDPGTKGLEMAVFGFSGWGTEALGRQLLEDPTPFWPPYARLKGRQVGVYICQFTMEAQNSPEGAEMIRAKEFKVIPMDKAILESYLR